MSHQEREPAREQVRVQVEELCEEIWSLTESGENTLARVTGGSKLADAGAALAELQRRGLARASAGRVVLSDEGGVMARAVVRRHRLAEVLFSEVMAVDEQTTESTACEMEHILSAQVTDSICTYLGHPPRCPHGKPIPRGGCCEVFRKEVRPLVMPLLDLGMGEEGRIVFIAGPAQGSLERVAALGVVPGSLVRLIQKRPSVVFEAGHTSIAVDPEIAGAIYVRRASAEA